MKQTRQAAIIAVLDAEGMVSVNALGTRFAVSEMTIRRDLLELEQAGLVRRVHGGATRSLGRAYEPPFRMRQNTGGNAKHAIAQRATRLILEGDAVGLDVGSTVLEMVPQFIDIDNLTVVTASLRVATRVADCHALERSVRLMVTGGITRADELSLTGQTAINSYRGIRLDKAFISVGGISLSDGATEFNLEDAEVKRAMIQSAKEVVVLADSSKFSQTGFAHIVDLSQVSTIITDDGIDPEIAEGILAAGVDLQVVSCDTA